MSRWVKVLAMVAVACLVAAPMVQADEGPRRGEPDKPVRPFKPPPPGDGPRLDGPKGPPPPPGAGLREALGGLGLNDDQKKQVDDLLATFQEEMKAAFDKNAEAIKTLQQQLKAAFEAKDEAKIKELRGELAKLMPRVEEKMKALRDQLRLILTEEQNKRLDERLRGMPGPRPLGPVQVCELALRNAEKLGLVDEQQTQLKDLLKAHHETVRAVGEDASKDEPAKKKAVKESVEKLGAELKALLTAEQAEQLRRLVEAAGKGPGPGPGPVGKPGERLLARLKELNLNESQARQVGDIVKAFEEAFKTAKPEEREALVKKLHKDVGDVLTPEQRGKLAPPKRPDGPRPEGERPKPEPAPLPPL